MSAVHQPSASRTVGSSASSSCANATHASASACSSSPTSGSDGRACEPGGEVVDVLRVVVRPGLLEPAPCLGRELGQRLPRGSGPRAGGRDGLLGLRSGQRGRPRRPARAFIAATESGVSSGSAAGSHVPSVIAVEHPRALVEPGGDVARHDDRRPPLGRHRRLGPTSLGDPGEHLGQDDRARGLLREQPLAIRHRRAPSASPGRRSGTNSKTRPLMCTSSPGFAPERRELAVDALLLQARLELGHLAVVLQVGLLIQRSTDLPLTSQAPSERRATVNRGRPGRSTTVG